MAKGGGSSAPTIIQPPAPPATPSPTQQTREYYTDILPLQMAAQQQYGPQMAEQDYQLFSQYAPKYSQDLANIDKQLYPETAGLQESLAKQAREGMTAPVPQEIMDQYRSDFNAGLGSNVNAPIGVSDRNIALIQLQKQWGDYYRNMGLSVAGRQPLQQPAQPNFRDPSGGLQGYYGASNAYAGNQQQGYATSLANRIVQPGGSRGSGMGAGIGGLLAGGAAMAIPGGAAFAPYAFAGGSMMGGSI